MRVQRFALLGWMPVALAAASGCGGSDSYPPPPPPVTTSSSSSGTTSSGASTTFPAPHPGPPRVIDAGGPVIASPTFVPIFFGNDDMTQVASIEGFVGAVGASSYWTTAVAEYGVGTATAAAPVQLTETAEGDIDDAAVQSWLTGKIDANDGTLPAPDASTIYVIHYPSAVTLQFQQGGETLTSCTDIGGYHNDLTLGSGGNGMPVAYAVIPRCQGFDDLVGLDAVTGAESHELIEASTDPYPQTNPAYAETDEPHLYWDLAIGGGEIGDMCAQDPEAFTQFPGLPYTVQRVWSNKAAAAGHDPCVPALAGEVYFNAAPVMNDNLALTIDNEPIVLTGVQIPVGGSKTIDVDLFSDGPTSGPIEVEALDLEQLEGMPADLGLSLDHASGVNGQTLHLTIDVKAKGPLGIEIFVLLATVGETRHLWVGDVGD